MNVSYTCRQCAQRVHVRLPAQTHDIQCPVCHPDATGQPAHVAGEKTADNTLSECLVCGCRELYVRKDFSQRLGVGIVVVGIVASTVAWGLHWGMVSYGILFATALVDVVLYFTVGNLLQCYRCQAEYRGLSELDHFEPFDLETHEKFRQQAIRMAQGK